MLTLLLDLLVRVDGPRNSFPPGTTIQPYVKFYRTILGGGSFLQSRYPCTPGAEAAAGPPRARRRPRPQTRTLWTFSLPLTYTLWTLPISHTLSLWTLSHTLSRRIRRGTGRRGKHMRVMASSHSSDCDEARSPTPAPYPRC